MQLYIHILSHPFLKQFFSIVQKECLSSQLKLKLHKQLGLFLIYEVARKWLVTKQLYVKHINVICKLTFVDSRESYIVITSNLHNYGLLLDSSNLLPNCDTIIFDWHNNFDSEKKIISNKKYSHIFNNVNSNKKIILIDQSIHTFSIIQLISYLVDYKKISISQIRLTCLTCHINVLEKLSQKHPKLKVYIVKIIYSYQLNSY